MPTQVAVDLARLREQERANQENEQREKFKAVASAMSPLKMSMKSNDPGFYIKDAQLAQATANLPWDEPFTGIDTELCHKPALMVIPFTTSLGNDYSLANISSAGVVSGYFGSQSVSTKIARQLDADVRGANAGASNYTSNTLFLYTLAFDSILTNLASMIRLYRSITAASNTNWNIGRAVCAAYGYPDSGTLAMLARNKKEIKKAILGIWSRLRTFNVPAKFDLIQKHIWNASVIFGDEFNEHAQLWMYMPIHVFRYTKATTTTNMGLEAVLVPFYQLNQDANGFKGQSCLTTHGHSAGTMAQFEAWVDLIYSAIDALLDDPAFTLVSGDILKRSRDKNLPPFPLMDFTQDLDLEGDIDFIYHDDVALCQVNNLDVIQYNYMDGAIPNAVYSGMDCFRIFENERETLVQGLEYSAHTFTPPFVLKSTGTWYQSRKTLYSTWDATGVEDVVEMTQGVLFYSTRTINTVQYQVILNSCTEYYFCPIFYDIMLTLSETSGYEKNMEYGCIPTILQSDACDFAVSSANYTALLPTIMLAQSGDDIPALVTSSQNAAYGGINSLSVLPGHYACQIITGVSRAVVTNEIGNWNYRSQVALDTMRHINYAKVVSLYQSSNTSANDFAFKKDNKKAKYGKGKGKPRNKAGKPDKAE